MWDGMILSDSLGMTLECMTLYFFYFSLKNKKKKDYILLAAFSLLFFTVRTNSISLLLVVAVTCLLSLPKEKRRIAAALTVLVVAAVVAALFMVGENAYYGLGKRVDYYRDYYLQGTIVFGRPEYDYQIPAGHKGSILFVFDILKMLLLKAVYYWSIYFKAFSKAHTILCFLTILPTFLFTLFSVICIIRDKVKQLYPFVDGIFSYSFIQIATEVDYDQRYRSPIFLLLIICSAYGVRKLYMMAGRHRNGQIG